MNGNKHVGWFFGLYCGIVWTALGTVPDGWFEGFINNEYQRGSASYSGTDITVTGRGTDFWGSSDSGYIVFKPFVGDCEIMADIPEAPRTGSWAADAWCRNALMMREGQMDCVPQVTFSRCGGVSFGGATLETGMRMTMDGGMTQWPDFRTRYATENSGQYHLWGYDSTGSGSAGYARLRLVRQGDVFTAWASSNANYTVWQKIAEVTNALTPGLVACIGVSSHLTSVDMTSTFKNVDAHSLVTATLASGATDATVAWVNDLPTGDAATNWVVAGYTVSRLDGASATATVIASVDAATLSATAATAAAGVRCRFRVTATLTNIVDGGAATTMLVGTSWYVRRSGRTTNANTAESPMRGLYAEYSEEGTFLSSRLEPAPWDGWISNEANVLPAYQETGLSDLNDFVEVQNGNMIVDKTGMYYFTGEADDRYYITVNDVLINPRDVWMGQKQIGSTPVWLEAGRSYPVKLRFEEDGGGEAARLRYNYDGTSTMSMAPQKWFYPFPGPWSHGDVSEEGVNYGNAKYDSESKAFTLYSAGAGFKDALDDGQFAWQDISGDHDIIASLSSLTDAASDTAPVAGVMFRTSFDSASAMFGVQFVKTSGGTKLQMVSRSASGASAEIATLAENVTLPIKLRLSRRSGDCRIYYDCTGNGWVSPTNVAMAVTGSSKVGMMLASGNTAVMASAVFSGISVVDASVSSITSISVVNGKATITAAKNASLVRQANAQNERAYWYWSDTILTAGYTVFRSYGRSGRDVLGDVIGTIIPPAATYVDTLTPSNAIVLYQMRINFDAGVMADGGADPNALASLSSVYGVADGDAYASNGTGLYLEVCTNFNSNCYATALPVHNGIRDLSYWDAQNNNVFVSAANSDTSIALGPLNFYATWAGYLKVPYSGWYRLSMFQDDCIEISINGSRIIRQWGYDNATKYAGPYWFDAGQMVPILVEFQQGTGGGQFNMKWWYGTGTSASYTEIPSTSLYPIVPDGTPFFVSPDSLVSSFGDWVNVDINSGCAGHAVLSGTPEDFDAKITAGGADAWGTTDGGHFVYQKLSYDKEFSLETTLGGIQYVNGWGKYGIMIRTSLDKGAKRLALFQTPANGVVMQYRTGDGDNESVNSGTANPTNNAGIAASSGNSKVTFKMVRKFNSLCFYINGVEQRWLDNTVYDMSGWGTSDIYVGLFTTAHDNGSLAESLFTDVKFSASFRPKTVILLK